MMNIVRMLKENAILRNMMDKTPIKIGNVLAGLMFAVNVVSVERDNNVVMILTVIAKCARVLSLPWLVMDIVGNVGEHLRVVQVMNIVKMDIKTQENVTLKRMMEKQQIKIGSVFQCMMFVVGVVNETLEKIVVKMPIVPLECVRDLSQVWPVKEHVKSAGEHLKDVIVMSIVKIMKVQRGNVTRKRRMEKQQIKIGSVLAGMMFVVSVGNNQRETGVVRMQTVRVIIATGLYVLDVVVSVDNK